MRRIVCEDCGKRYDYDEDEFCPRCGAFNQPVKRWGVDAAGNVIRVDGVNEQDHAGSFVHSEVHHEKDERRKKGLDWQSGRKGAAPRPTPAANPYSSQQMRRKNQTARNNNILGVVIFLIIIAAVNLLMPLLSLLFG